MVPSQIGSTCASRSSRGTPVSSTYPAPPKLSTYSLAEPTASRPVASFASGATMRSSAAASGSAPTSTRPSSANACPARANAPAASTARVPRVARCSGVVAPTRRRRRAARRRTRGRRPDRVASRRPPRRRCARRVTTTRVIARTRPGTAGSPSGTRVRVVQADLGGGQRPGAELVLEPVHGDARGRRVRCRAGGQRRVGRVAGDQERCEHPAAPAGALRAGQRHRHRRVGRRAEPLLPGQPPRAVRGGPADGAGAPQVGAALRLGHPLPAGDRRGRVGGDQPGQPGVAHAGVDVGQAEQRRGPVGHRHRAGERRRLRAVQVQQGVLHDPGGGAPGAARVRQVGQRDHGVPGGGGALRLPAGARSRSGRRGRPTGRSGAASAGAPRRRRAPRAAAP